MISEIEVKFNQPAPIKPDGKREYTVAAFQPRWGLCVAQYTPNRPIVGFSAAKDILYATNGTVFEVAGMFNSCNRPGDTQLLEHANFDSTRATDTATAAFDAAHQDHVWRSYNVLATSSKKMCNNAIGWMYGPKPGTTFRIDVETKAGWDYQALNTYLQNSQNANSALGILQFITGRYFKFSVRKMVNGFDFTNAPLREYTLQTLSKDFASKKQIIAFDYGTRWLSDAVLRNDNNAFVTTLDNLSIEIVDQSKTGDKCIIALSIPTNANGAGDYGQQGISAEMTSGFVEQQRLPNGQFVRINDLNYLVKRNRWPVAFCEFEVSFDEASGDVIFELKTVYSRNRKFKETDDIAQDMPTASIMFKPLYIGPVAHSYQSLYDNSDTDYVVPDAKLDAMFARASTACGQTITRRQEYTVSNPNPDVWSDEYFYPETYEWDFSMLQIVPSRLYENRIIWMQYDSSGLINEISLERDLFQTYWQDRVLTRPFTEEYDPLNIRAAVTVKIFDFKLSINGALVDTRTFEHVIWQNDLPSTNIYKVNDIIATSPSQLESPNDPYLYGFPAYYQPTKNSILIVNYHLRANPTTAILEQTQLDTCKLYDSNGMLVNSLYVPNTEPITNHVNNQETLGVYDVFCTQHPKSGQWILFQNKPICFV